MRILFVFILSIKFAFLAQSQVSLTPLTFENGFKYPHANFPKDKSIEDKLNSAIIEHIQDLESSDFCIGEYGYVQKGSHLEIHIFCTCIDLPESEHRYVLLNTETGESVFHSDLFAEKEQKDALAFIQKRLGEYKSTNELCQQQFTKITELSTYEDIAIRLYKDGIEVRPASTTDCEQTPLRLTWEDLKPFLRYHFI
jgi:hypothetical protein